MWNELDDSADRLHSLVGVFQNGGENERGQQRGKGNSIANRKSQNNHEKFPGTATFQSRFSFPNNKSHGRSLSFMLQFVSVSLLLLGYPVDFNQ